VENYDFVPAIGLSKSEGFRQKSNL